MYFQEGKCLLLQSAIKQNGKKMKYYKNILKFLFPIWILVSSSICQNLVVDLTLLNTSEYTLGNWKNLEDLWYVEVENNTSQNIDYYLTFTLKKDSNDLVTGTTRPLIIQSGPGNYNSERYTNLDPDVFEATSKSIKFSFLPIS